jgi:hypothetical protein
MLDSSLLIGSVEEITPAWLTWLLQTRRPQARVAACEVL